MILKKAIEYECYVNEVLNRCSVGKAWRPASSKACRPPKSLHDYLHL